MRLALPCGYPIDKTGFCKDIRDYLRVITRTC